MICDQDIQFTFYNPTGDMSALMSHHGGEHHVPEGSTSGSAGGQRQVRKASLCRPRLTLQYMESSEGACMVIRTYSTDTRIGSPSMEAIRGAHAINLKCHALDAWCFDLIHSMIPPDMTRVLCSPDITHVLCSITSMLLSSLTLDWM